MATINLREFYPDYYTEDTFVEASDEVETVLKDERRLQNNYKSYTRYHKAYYSLDYGNGIENAILYKPEQPDEALLRKELVQTVREALAKLPEKQRRRIYAHFMEDMKKIAIAEQEGVSPSSVYTSIKSGYKNLRKILDKYI